MYAFFITPLFSESIAPIHFSIDPIENTAYYLEPFFPSLQQDIHVFDIRINGELGLPLSTFVFDVDESPVPLYDSLRTRSVFHFIKGDYGFRDLGVKTQSLTLNGGTLTGFAHTRSYNGVNGYIGEGSLMQNYLLSYRNNFKNSKFSITTAYHNEDMDVPISNLVYSTKVNESYFSGISLSHQTRFGKFKYFSDLQVSESKIENNKREDWIHTQRAGFKFNSMGRVTPFLTWTENEENQDISRLGFNWGDSLTHVSLNSTYINSPQIELTFSKKFRSAYIQMERKILDDYTDSTDSYILNSLTLGLANNSFYVQIVPSAVTVDSFSFNSYSWSVGYENDIFMLNAGGYFYDNNEWGLKRVVKTDMQINFPYFERYTPYLKTEYNNYFFGESTNTDLLIGSRFAEIYLGDMNEIAHCLNFEFGFNLEIFKVSYHYKNILGEDGRFTHNYEQVPMHKYLKVEWQFRN